MVLTSITRLPAAEETSVPKTSFGCSRTEPVLVAIVPVESRYTGSPKTLRPQEPELASV